MSLEERLDDGVAALQRIADALDSEESTLDQLVAGIESAAVALHRIADEMRAQREA